MDARGTSRSQAPGSGRWLTRVAPAAARGTVNIALVSDARVRALNRRFRGDQRTDGRPEFSRTPATSASRESVTASRESALGRHRDRPRRGASAGARGRALRADRVAGAGAARAAAPHRYDHDRDDGGCSGSKRGSDAKAGLREGLIERAAQARDTRWSIFLAGVRRRLSRRDRGCLQRADAAVAAAGRRAQRPSRTTSAPISTIPLLLFVPVRLLLGLVTAAATALLAAAIGVDGAHRRGARHRERGRVHRGLRVSASARHRESESGTRATSPAAVLQSRSRRALGPFTQWIARLGAGSEAQHHERRRRERRGDTTRRRRPTSIPPSKRGSSRARSAGCSRASWTSATRSCAK